MPSPSHVLVVDDDEAFRRAIVAALEAAGFRTSEARNGREGLEKIRAETPDVVLLDLLMPELDGASVLTALAADGTLEKMPVIVVTGLASSHVPAMLKASEFLFKPVTAEEIISAVTRCLRRFPPTTPA